MNNLRVFGKHLTGVKAHKWQRISAIFLMLYFPYLAWQVSNINIEHNISLTALIQQIFTPGFLLLSLICLALIFVHAWVGVRDMMIDYLPQKNTSIWLTAYALFLLFILIDLTFLAIQIN